MEQILKQLSQGAKELLSSGKFLSFVSLLGIVLVIFIFFKILRRIVMPVVRQKCNAQAQYLIDRALHYMAIVVVVMTVFSHLGIDFTALIGVAGIAGIAIGFAAQTSVSNVISGLFVMTERAFRIGDILKVDSVTGTVESFDLLSVRLKTFDNQLVRIPNETIIKTNLVNMTHYEHRRFTLRVGVAYGTDLRKVKDVLLDVAVKNAFAVTEPAPVVVFDAFAASSIDVMVGVWGLTASYVDLRNSLMIEVSERLAAEGISIAFPQLDVHLMPHEGGSSR